MKLRVLQENLETGLAMVTRTTSRRSTLPILSHVLLKTESGRLQLTATDLEMMIVCPVGAKIEEEGAITVPAQPLLELVKSLPSEVIDLEVEDSILHLQCGRFETHLHGLSAEEFPIVPEFPSEVLQVKMGSELLHRMITWVAFAAAGDNLTHPALNGVLFSLGTQQCTMVATDGFRLSVYHFSRVSQGEESPSDVSGEEGQAEVEDASAHVIVPARALMELARICSKEEPVVIAVAEENQVFFQHQGVMLVSQLVEGHFPDYRQILPTGWKTKAEVDRKALLQAVKMAGIFAGGEGKVIRLSFAPEAGSGLVTVAGSGEVGEHVGEIEAGVEGERLSISFAAGYLVAPLSRLNTDWVVLEGVTPTSPMVIRPLGDDGNANEEYIHLVMPLHLREEGKQEEEEQEKAEAQEKEMES